MYVITAEDIRSMNASHGREYRNNNVLKAIVEHLKPYRFTTMATFRPKKTRINAVNAFDLFLPALWQYPQIDQLFYAIEKDRYGKSSHAHLLLNGDITKHQFAEAINRNASAELPYWENIKDVEAAIVYTNKRSIEGDQQGYGQISQKDVTDKIDMDCGIIPHPNKKYHDRAEMISSKVYGWKKFHKGYY